MIIQYALHSGHKDWVWLDVGGYRVDLYDDEYRFLTERDAGEYELVKQWCAERLLPYMTRRSINPRHTSYGIKHIAENEDELGFYVCNADIKLALAELGVRHDPKDGINYTYPLSENFFKER